MNNMRKIAATFTSAAAIAALFTVSASAETRHRDETTTTTTTTHERSSRHDGQTQTQQYNNRGTRNYDRSNGDRNYGQRSTEQLSYDRSYNNNSNRNYDRSQTYNRNYDRNYGRNETRSYNYDRGRTQNYRSYVGHADARGRAWYPTEGRVSRFVHENGGYRVWISGGRYPVWIPEARWRLFPLRIGLSIRFGGWLDPLGYIDAYEYGPLGGPYYGGDPYYAAPVYSSGELRGVVENVDYGRGTVVLRDDNTGNIVTAFMRDRGLGDIRPGDFVALSGGCTRSGVFEAYRLNDIEGGRY